MAELVLYSREGEIGIISVDNPPVNALSPGVPEGIQAGVERFEADPEVLAMVLIGKGRTFIAGADIKEFGKITSQGKRRGAGLNPILNRIESCAKPVVAAIHGTALGGGLETAMACHYRVASGSAQVGQPEVKLGLIPGAGGTQRLPRLAGVERALQMCVGGNPIGAGEALEAGIIDRLIAGDLLGGAVSFARDILLQSSLEGARRTRDRDEKLGRGQDHTALFAAVREETRRKQRNLMAPLAAVDAVEAATLLSFDEGLQREGELFEQCLFSDQSKALIHVFFGEREVAKIPDVPKDTPVLPVARAAVVGAGTMGGGIAMAFANAGIPVLLKEVDQPALERGVANVRKNYESSVRKGRLAQDVMDERVALITPTLDWNGFADADMVVEAVYEGLALKKQVFGELDKVCRRGAILATNTSTLSIDEIASATARPEAVIGTHFFSPANIMRLLEIVRGQATSSEVIATCMALARKLGKVGVVVGNCRAFAGNRMFGPYRREAQFLVEEGASVEAVDRALFDFGMAMGPLATGDLAGLDVGWRIRKESGEIDDRSVRQPLLEDRLCEMGRYGQKTGAGWYRYDENRRPVRDPLVDQLVHETRAALGIPQRQIDDQEIVDRCIFALVNEGARILEEGIALRAVDLDVIYINGYGFPAYRGGPMWYADTVGPGNVFDRVSEFQRMHGDPWQPAPLLERLAKSGGTFAAYVRGQAVQV